MAKAKKGPTAAKTAALENATSDAVGLPLFFEKPATLDSVRHANAGIRSDATLAFARACNSVPLNAIEFIEAARCYPIVFSNEENPFPVSVFGWDLINPFIEENDQWRADCYIPAYVRQYPFTLFEAPNSDKLYLCVDEASSAYVDSISSKTVDVIPFYADGKVTDATKRALEFAHAFYQQSRITRAFCDDLKHHNLLTPYDATMRLDGTEKQLKGFLMVNETAFNALPEAAFLELRAKGWLPFIYLSLASAVNWKRMMA